MTQNNTSRICLLVSCVRKNTVSFKVWVTLGTALSKPPLHPVHRKTHLQKYAHQKTGKLSQETTCLMQRTHLHKKLFLCRNTIDRSSTKTQGSYIIAIHTESTALFCSLGRVKTSEEQENCAAGCTSLCFGHS